MNAIIAGQLKRSFFFAKFLESLQETKRSKQISQDMILFLILIILLGQYPETGRVAAQDECQPMRCGHSSPIIRFPFRLKDRQPASCGYPGFEVSCDSTNRAEFELQFPLTATAENIVIPLSVRALIQDIDYTSQLITISVMNSTCFPDQVPRVNSSISRFHIYYPDKFDMPSYGGYTFFNCSSKPENSAYSGPITCLSSRGYQVYAFHSIYGLYEFPFSSCLKMYDIPEVTVNILVGSSKFYHVTTQLQWSKPSCKSCEAYGRYCRLKSNSTSDETECSPTPPGDSKKFIIAGIVVGVFLMALVAIALYRVISLKKEKKRLQRKITQCLEDYKALRPTRYTYADIKKITEGFKYRLGQGGYGTVYKGKLSNDISVAIKVLNNMKGNGEEFINEVGTIGKIHHVNVVRLVGYCADGYRRALVYEFLPNDSLEKFISAGDQGQRLRWQKLHNIAIGIAKGIDYLHQGCNQRIVHFDIKPHNILLDHSLNPKVADFGLAKLCSKEQSIVSMTAARGTIGYIAPEVFSRNFGNVSYRSDIYSFGMVLLDIVGGRKKFHACAQESSSQVYFPEWMYNQLEKGGDIAIQIENEDENEIVKRLIIVGLWCIQWYPADRPSMKVVIQMLEAEEMPIMPPNPFVASKPEQVYAATCGSITSSSESDSMNL